MRSRRPHFTSFVYNMVNYKYSFEWCVKNCLLDSKLTWSQWKINVFDLCISCKKGKDRDRERNKNYWIKQTCQCDGLLPWNHQNSVHFTFFSLLFRRHTSFICIILSRHESHTYLYMKPKSPKWKKKTTNSISNYITVHFTIRYSWIGNNIFFHLHRIASHT